MMMYDELLRRGQRFHAVLSQGGAEIKLRFLNMILGQWMTLLLTIAVNRKICLRVLKPLVLILRP
ncbi:hypothetical protein N665_3913s0004 [Sinapis alba]|nr:hypothetical protein N665_3913s0004 [Sinapis alba]